MPWLKQLKTFRKICLEYPLTWIILQDKWANFITVNLTKYIWLKQRYVGHNCYKICPLFASFRVHLFKLLNLSLGFELRSADLEASTLTTKPKLWRSLLPRLNFSDSASEATEQKIFQSQVWINNFESLFCRQKLVLLVLLLWLWIKSLTGSKRRNAICINFPLRQKPTRQNNNKRKA